MDSIRTDMAKEAVDIISGGKIDGIKAMEYSFDDDISVSIVDVLNDKGEKILNKNMGRYVTIEYLNGIIGNKDYSNKLSKCVSLEIKKMIPKINPCDTVLVVGLGNKNFTADALGPLTCEKVFVSRHIKEYVPEMIDNRTSGVCAIATGVLGETGIESFDIIDGIVNKIDIKLIIVIDALAAGSFSRLGTSVQLSNAGISPGSGVGNKRNAINKEAFNIPVVAIGVPTVVYASAIFNDIINNTVLNTDIDNKVMQRITDSIQSIEGEDMIMTPKDIDIIVERSSKILADSLNLALHGHLSAYEIEKYMN